MATLYGLQASGILRSVAKSEILCGRLFTERGFAEEHIPEFRRACTSSPDAAKDLIDHELLKIHMIEFKLVK